jgi:hypothetical protein
MAMYYKLEGHETVPATVHEFAELYENPTLRQVGDTMLKDYRISTVFLGVDHGSINGENPILFETMVFYHGDGEDDLGLNHEQERYSTWDEAEAGHKRWVEEVREETMAYLQDNPTDDTLT